MNYLQNHIWCSDSIWGGEYNCRHIVSFSSYGDESVDDWALLIDESAETAEETLFGTDLACTKKVPNLRPEVLMWLSDNVKDRKTDSSYKHSKGWAIGTPQYRLSNVYQISVFFHRKRDAMAFIKRWSKWGKPTHYCQYFTDVRKELDLTTGKYKRC